MEMFFLVRRLEDLQAIASSDEVIIQDRKIFEGVNIFVRNNYEMGNLSERDYKAYMELYSVMMAMVKEPDLLIYLRSSIQRLVGHITKRGRGYEQGMSIDYLKRLNERYEEWIASYKGNVLIIDADDLDFENRAEDFSFITDKIDSRLYGLFNENR